MTSPVNRQPLLSGNEMMQILLPIHILAGTIALLCAAMAVSSEKGKKLHVLSGRTYFWCMVAIFLTSIPMSIITSNIFLFLIAIFSFYLAFAGMRFARNRKGVVRMGVGALLLAQTLDIVNFPDLAEGNAGVFAC
jgi:uncharacterized membrane protein